MFCFDYHIYMIKRIVPFAYADSLFEVSAAFYQKFHIKAVLCDLDNTLDSYDHPFPSERVFALKRFFSEQGIQMIIVSNNTGRRVRIYAQSLGCRAVCWMMKPLAGRLKRFIKSEGLKPDEVLLVGDQLMTDILAGNGAGLRTLLVAPISRKSDPPWTRCNRCFEKRTRYKILIHRIVLYWRNML